MKCLREVAVISRHYARHSSLTPVGIRNASTRHGKPYELTPLVMDLDAADNTQVRQVKEIPEEEWKGVQRFHNQIVKFLEIEQSKRARLEKRRQLRQYLGFNALIVTPPDLLQLALFGDPYKQNADAPVTTGYLKGISTYLELHKKDPQRLKIWSFIKELPLDGEAALRKAGFGLSDEKNEAIIKRMREKPYFKRLQRVITILSQTEEGCKFLLSHMKDVKFILDNSTKHSSDYLNILVTINNLVASIHSKGLEIDSYLCNIGLHFASRLNSHLAVRKYLDIAIKNSYRPNYQSRKAALRLAVPKLPLAAPRLWLKGEDDERQDILTLLTGWKSNGIPATNEVQQPCFSILAHQNHSSRPLYLGYIQALGELGAAEALWYEFNQVARSLTSRLPSSVMITTSRLYEAFMTAFLIARDTRSALEVSSQAEAAGLDLSRTAAALPQSVDVDNQAKSPPKPRPTTPEDPVIASLLFTHLSIRGRRSVLGPEYEKTSNERENLLTPISSTVLNNIEKISSLKEKVHAIETLLAESVSKTTQGAEAAEEAEGSVQSG
ncbi:hypothetical protein F5884DRAFT_799763 [Xylogone sp. PMI_703]|nr:hypothetical protein F5884DRAFT_799763 [Xylogone sp. PMI_703]